MKTDKQIEKAIKSAIRKGPRNEDELIEFAAIALLGDDFEDNITQNEADQLEASILRVAKGMGIGDFGFQWAPVGTQQGEDPSPRAWAKATLTAIENRAIIAHPDDLTEADFEPAMNALSAAEWRNEPTS